MKIEVFYLTYACPCLESTLRTKHAYLEEKADFGCIRFPALEKLFAEREIPPIGTKIYFNDGVGDEMYQMSLVINSVSYEVKDDESVKCLVELEDDMNISHEKKCNELFQKHWLFEQIAQVVSDIDPKIGTILRKLSIHYYDQHTKEHNDAQEFKNKDGSNGDFRATLVKLCRKMKTIQPS